MNVKPSKASPPLPKPQIIELRRIAACERPTTGSTLLCWPLHHHGLITNSKREGFPEYRITDKGRSWLESYDEWVASLPPSRRPKGDR